MSKARRHIVETKNKISTLRYYNPVRELREATALGQPENKQLERPASQDVRF
jgi:hypothetical protein